MSKHVVVIGAGIAGLTAGIYAKRSGFEVTIVEQHTIPGGMCTSWRRKGYLFEGAIHWLTGSSPQTAFYELWRDVGAIDDSVKVRYDDPFKSIEWEGKIICLYRDLETLRKHFNEISPEDTEATERLISDIKTLSEIDKLRQLSVEEYVSNFKHPAMRPLLYSVVPKEYSADSLIFSLATLAAGDGGYPEGGSLAMTRRMADKFKSLGGKLLLGTKVDKIVTQNGVATGVRCNDRILTADAVIITQETLAAVEQLFDAPPKDEWLTELRRNTKPAVCCFIGVGICANMPEISMFEVREPIQCGGFSYSVLAFNNYAGYEGYAPEGGTALTMALLDDSYDFWKKAHDEGRYEIEKRAVADQITDALCHKYPHVEGKIEAVDVATPLTYERYTGASRGSWMSIIGKGGVNREYPCDLEQVKNVYFAGHRTMPPGGLPIALITGRNAVQMVCREFGEMFI